MRKIEGNLSTIFNVELNDITEIGEVDNSPKNEIIIESPKDKDVDFSAARENIISTINKSASVLDHAISVAKQSDHPRAFEVVSDLMRTIVDMNKNLLEIHKQKKTLDTSDPDQPKTVTNNNTVFLGSTNELSKLIAKMNKGELPDNSSPSD